jgi:hypothetical protein
MDKVEIRTRLVFYRAALDKLREAYLALVGGRVKSYTIEDRQLTRFDIDTLRGEISETENYIDRLSALLDGKKARKAFGIIPRDW